MLSEISVMHTSVCIYTHMYIPPHTHLIHLRQSLQLNWAFMKALIGPFWPNYHTLIKINPNGSSKYKMKTVHKWLIFTPPDSSFLF